MIRVLRHAFAALLLAVLYAAGLPAHAHGFTAIALNELLGIDVVEPGGAKIGEVRDLVLELQGARLHYVVLELGALGMGEKQFAYPISALAPGRSPDQVVLNVEPHRLERAEGFDRGRWPAPEDDYWNRIERAHHGEPAPREAASVDPGVPARTQAERTSIPPAAQSGASIGQSSAERFGRATELLGMPVKDRRSKAAGTVADLVLNLRDARVQYLVVDNGARRMRVSMARRSVVQDGRALMLEDRPKSR